MKLKLLDKSEISLEDFVKELKKQGPSKTKLYYGLRKNVFKFDNKKFFRLLHPEEEANVVIKKILKFRDSIFFDKLIKKKKELLPIVSYLFKKLEKKHLCFSWLPQENQPEPIFYNFSVNSHPSDSKNSKNNLNKYIIEAQIYSKNIQLAKEILCWKIIELFFPTYLNRIINIFTFEDFSKYCQFETKAEEIIRILRELDLQEKSRIAAQKQIDLIYYSKNPNDPSPRFFRNDRPHLSRNLQLGYTGRDSNF